jgi:hypothetical protein
MSAAISVLTTYVIVDLGEDIDPNDKYALNDKGRALIDLRNYTGAIPYLHYELMNVTAAKTLRM